MHLLNLPTELLEYIFDFSSVTSCLQTAYTCRTLFAVLSNYRKGLLYQLSQLPSTPRTLSTVNTSHSGGGDNNDNELSSKGIAELFLLLQRRAAQQLRGANFHANQSVYTFDKDAPAIDTLASTIHRDGDPNVALVQKGLPSVFLYFVSGGQMVPRGVLEAFTVCPGKVEVIKAVISDRGNTVSVLQRFTPFPAKDGENGSQGVGESGTVNGHGKTPRNKHPFEEEAMRPYRAESTQLVHYRRSKPGSGYSRVTISAFPSQDEYRPLAIAVADQYLVAISWQHKQYPDRRMIVVHTAQQDETAGKMKLSYQVYNDNIIIDEDGTMPYDNGYHRHRNTRPIEPVIQMAFNDGVTQLLYYHPASTIYGHFQRINLEPGGTISTSGLLGNSCWVIYRNNLTINNVEEDNLKFTIAIPFFSTHETVTNHLNREQCHWKYLALGTATDNRGELVACILMAETFCRSVHCHHIENLDRGRRFDSWRVVARLAGYSTSVNTLPGIVATSRRATRLAIANWKTITVWPLDPQAIIERNASGVYPENMIDAGVTGAVLLEPVVLESEAVCFMLSFGEGEDEIVSLTDRGVMRWEIGAGTVGRKEGAVLGLLDGAWGNEGESEGEESANRKIEGAGVDTDEEGLFVYEGGESEIGSEMSDDSEAQGNGVEDEEDEEMEDADNHSDGDGGTFQSLLPSSSHVPP
ncbi:F-box domain-containing protein [Histoplasma capsulatum G186AR]|uniref:F-box domain-containing protein n=1 Tax=Ajellomyces capsulatus (strain G186AR / H82 / ATCC MYA-2454 / RMSCC 2432) TaxID=447093 RepID=C0NYT8_AJECG|nr:F-box domain-containing protein [Histoplasma capsulatum G186AR]EEH03378.1 F-box domain-containing protein [Histoplasma capsulatum G186AR]